MEETSNRPSEFLGGSGPGVNRHFLPQKRINVFPESSTLWLPEAGPKSQALPAEKAAGTLRRFPR